MLLYGFTHAQDLTGKWVIAGNMDTGYYGELNLVLNQKNIYAGHSYDTEADGFCRHWLEANYDPKTKTFKGEDVELIDKSPTHSATDYDLHYYVENGKEYLAGTQSIISLKDTKKNHFSLKDLFEDGLILRDSYRPKKTRVTYMKVSNTYKPHTPDMPNIMSRKEIENENAKATKPKNTPLDKQTSPSPAITDKKIIPVEKNDTVIKDNSIVNKKNNRNNKLLSHITVQNIDEITLLITDYGEEDNDTISVFFNNALKINNLRLSHETKEFHFKLNKKSINELIFVANNLGTVPPNTARITIIANKRRYNYKLFTDERNNALIRIENQ